MCINILQSRTPIFFYKKSSIKQINVMLKRLYHIIVIIVVTLVREVGKSGKEVRELLICPFPYPSPSLSVSTPFSRLDKRFPNQY